MNEDYEHCGATHSVIPLTHSAYVLSCLEERTACISIFS